MPFISTLMIFVLIYVLTDNSFVTMFESHLPSWILVEGRDNSLKSELADS